MDKSFEILDQFRQFMQNRVVLTGAELGIFDLIGKNPGRDVNFLANQLDADKRGITRLLDCLVAMDFLEKREGKYYLNETGEYLTSDHSNTILPMVLHYVTLWKNWSNLTETVKKGRNPNKILALEDEESTRAFINGMKVIASKLAEEIVNFFDASDRKILLDIGAGPGVYTIYFLKKYPDLKAIIFDLPEVVEIAKENIEREGLSSRVTFVKGDFYKDPLPTGSDLALLSAIIHQNSPKENIKLYKSIYHVLDSGGKVLIRDHIMSEDRTYPPAGALFALNMLVGTPGGDTYTFSEVKDALETAGFTKVKLVRKGTKMDCLVEAIKL